MAPEHLAEFRSPIWKTGNSLVLTVPESVVNSRGLVPGYLLHVLVDYPTFMAQITPSYRDTYSMHFDTETVRKVGSYFPEPRKRFLVEIEGKQYRLYRTDSWSVSGFAPFYQRHPRLSRVRWHVVEPQKSFRIEFDDSWTD